MSCFSLWPFVKVLVKLPQAPGGFKNRGQGSECVSKSGEGEAEVPDLREYFNPCAVNTHVHMHVGFAERV
jgi:hypothetical protein